ncbi:MAG: putative transcriptional regulator [Verrucomicrobiales bacterium]|nr:putative transcriptional regulator [Verrucomicrobiales bacterium]
MENEQKKKEAIALRLSLARKQAGLSQAQVANILNLHRPSVSEAEAGRRNVTATELSKLAEVYGVSVDWLSCTDSSDGDEFRDKLTLAARELAKLKNEDLEKVLGLLSALKQTPKQ